MKTIIGTAAIAALGWVTLATTAPYARAQGAAAAQQPAAAQTPAKKGKQVKDTGEYDIYNEVVKDAATNPPNPKKFLADLDNWTQKYPETDFKDNRIVYYVTAYRMSNELGKAVDAAKPLVDKGIDGMKEALDSADGSAVLNLLFLTSSSAGALAATGSPTPDELAIGTKAAQELADLGNQFFAPEKRGTHPEADWAAGLKQVEDQAQISQFQIAMYPVTSALRAPNQNDPAHCATAEAALLTIMPQYPKSGVVAQQMATVSRCQQATSPAKVQQALYYYARAAALPTGGIGGLDANGQKALDEFVKKAYTSIHGSDEGLADLKTLAANSPTMPADFKIKTATEIAQAKQQEFQSKNPQLAMWMNIKGQLADSTGQQYFEEQLKEHDMSGDNGAKLLKGVLVDAKPSACRPKELLVAFPMPDSTGTPAAELTLKLDAPLTGKVETGSEIAFNGVPMAFTKDPFMLTMDTEKAKIDGLTLTPCAAAAPKKGPATTPTKK